MGMAHAHGLMGSAVLRSQPDQRNNAWRAGHGPGLGRGLRRRVACLRLSSGAHAGMATRGAGPLADARGGRDAGRILRRLLVPALIGTWRTSPCRLWLCPPPRETLNTEPSPATQSQSHCCTRGFRSWILRGASTTTHVASQLRRVAHAARQSTPCCWPTVTFEVVKVGTQPAVLPANCVRKGSNKAGYR